LLFPEHETWVAPLNGLSFGIIFSRRAHHIKNLIKHQHFKTKKHVCNL